MVNNFFRMAWPVPVCLSLLLSACSSVNLWPFGREEVRERSRTPSNASEYKCAGEKRFYLRSLDNGGAAWLILADREVRLDKTASTASATSAAGTNYSNGITVLNLNGDEATLTDGAANTFSNCKKAANK
ncbi:MAG: hypothetical protein WC073_11950 [Sterolibacterium sp.]